MCVYMYTISLAYVYIKNKIIRSITTIYHYIICIFSLLSALLFLFSFLSLHRHLKRSAVKLKATTWILLMPLEILVYIFARCGFIQQSPSPHICHPAMSFPIGFFEALANPTCSRAPTLCEWLIVSDVRHGYTWPTYIHVYPFIIIYNLLYGQITW